MRAKLRICHLGKFYPPAPGGMETHVRALAQAQVVLGADVRVVCVNHRDRHGQDATWKPFAVTELVEEWDGPVRLLRMGRFGSVAKLDLCFALPRLLSQFSRATVDLLHLHVPNPTMLLALATMRLHCPLIVTYHSDVIRQRILGMALRPFEHCVFRRVARILSDSPSYPSGSPLLQRYLGKVSVLPLGLDLDPYVQPSALAQAGAQQLQAEHGTPLWLSVGRLVYYKGLQHAIRALPRVPGKLMIVGQGPLEMDLKRQAQQVGVADRVLWRGHLSADELVGAYHAATALWFPSNARSEGFGLVQVEAMACGCPVINTSIPASGVSWVSRHEESGLTVPVDDPVALAGAANRLLTEAGLRERLSSNARARACQEFDHMTMARRSLAIYQDVLAKRSSAIPDPVRGHSAL